MKPKHLIVLCVGLVAAWGLVKMSQQDNSDKPDEQIGKVLYDSFKTDAVTTIIINGGKEEVTLELKSGKWGVKGRDGYAANFDNIDSLVKRVADLYVRSVKAPVSSKNLGQFKLQAPGTGGNDSETGTTIVCKDADGKELANLTVGKAPSGASTGGFSSGGSGQYVLLASAPEKAYTVKNGFDSFLADSTNKAWIDKVTFFKAEKHKSVTSTSAKPEEDWKLFREKEGTDAAELKLDVKPGEDFDSSKATASATALSSAAPTDVAVGDEKAKAGIDKPTKTILIETFDGFKYTVKVGAQAPAAVAAAGADAPASGNEEYYISADVEGTFSETAPEWKPSADDEKKPEDEKKKLKETADAAFQTELKTKKDKLAKEKALAGTVFRVAKYTVDPLLKSRKDFMKDPPAPASTPGGEGGAPGAAPSPSPAPSPAPMPAPPAAAAPTPAREPISATTPPIAVDVKDGKAVATPVSAEELKKAEDAAKKAAEDKKPEEKK